MRCEVGSCQAKATFVVSQAYPYSSKEDTESATCGRHLAPVVRSLAEDWERVEVMSYGAAPESPVEPRSVPGGTPGREPAPSAVSGDAGPALDLDGYLEGFMGSDSEHREPAPYSPWHREHGGSAGAE